MSAPLSGAVVIARLRDVIAGDRDRPATALHVGEQAHELLSAVAGWATHKGKLLPALYGVPIVVGSVQEPPLSAYGWRLLDAEGNVIVQGIVSP